MTVAVATSAGGMGMNQPRPGGRKNVSVMRAHRRPTAPGVLDLAVPVAHAGEALARGVVACLADGPRGLSGGDEAAKASRLIGRMPVAAWSRGGAVATVGAR
jgi:hypothetical protein